jgi:tRNA(Ile2)-agmatinylcytidine synthase
MLLGVDDTDSLEGGCTTHVAVQLVLHLREGIGLVLLDHPRLVRLNPSNPWKTRGNAALALHLGEPAGVPRTIGEWDGDPIEAYPEGREVAPSIEVMKAAWEVVGDHTWEEDGRTNPGLVLTEGPGPSSWYQEALHGLVEVEPTVARLDGNGILHRGDGTRRGLIGAAAALSWPGEPNTWELLAYRPDGRWGKERSVVARSVERMEAVFLSTFDSMDRHDGGLTMVPSSPCPVLYGIRGTDPNELPQAHRLVEGEPAQGWLVFRTNQATDDHLVPMPLADARPYQNVAIAGVIDSLPQTLEGGHVVIGMEDGGIHLDLTAYEPTKSFRAVVRQLLPGDRVMACGSIRDEPRTLNMEKLKVLSLASPTETVKVANPRCPDCGRAMKSIGTGAGFRCPDCGSRAGEDAVVTEERPRAIAPGWYEVPSGARRHLARPLNLGVRPDLDALV